VILALPGLCPARRGARPKRDGRVRPNFRGFSRLRWDGKKDAQPSPLRDGCSNSGSNVPVYGAFGAAGELSNARSTEATAISASNFMAGGFQCTPSLRTNSDLSDSAE
jgi:hypothetical protein